MIDALNSYHVSTAITFARYAPISNQDSSFNMQLAYRTNPFYVKL